MSKSSSTCAQPKLSLRSLAAGITEPMSARDSFKGRHFDQEIGKMRTSGRRQRTAPSKVPLTEKEIWRGCNESCSVSRSRSSNRMCDFLASGFWTRDTALLHNDEAKLQNAFGLRWGLSTSSKTTSRTARTSAQLLAATVTLQRASIRRCGRPRVWRVRIGLAWS